MTPNLVGSGIMVINEFLASNVNTHSDEMGDYDDWIEIFNPGLTTINLAGMTLTDNLGNPTKWSFPAGTTLASGGYLIVWADDEATEGPLHASFKLGGSTGESIGIYNTAASGGGVIDAIEFGIQTEGVSQGRRPNGSGPIITLEVSSPGQSNDLNLPTRTPTATATPVVGLGLVAVNEVMAANKGTHSDELGEYEDWVELHNMTNQPYSLTGCYLSDDFGDPIKWAFPSGTTIPSQGFLIVWLDNDLDQGVLHANFSLKAEGEEIGLFDTNGNRLLDGVGFGPQSDDISYGRIPDGSGDFTLLYCPSPEAGNETVTTQWIQANYVLDQIQLFRAGQNNFTDLLLLSTDWMGSRCQYQSGR
jgi:hypothetical protein